MGVGAGGDERREEGRRLIRGWFCEGGEDA